MATIQVDKEVVTAVIEQSVKYFEAHRGKTFVVKVGGEIVRTPNVLDALAKHIRLCRIINCRIVLVHGGGPQASELSTRLGMEPKKVAGRRITDRDTLQVLKMVFSEINLDIVSVLRSHRLKVVGLSGVDGGLLHAQRRPVVNVADPATGITQQVDYGLVGDIIQVDSGLLETVLAGGYLPVVSSLSGNDSGEVYNTNADTVAAQIAIALKADKLIMLTDAPGLLEDPGNPATLISHVTTLRARDLLKSGAVRGGMMPKLEAVISAVEGGVRRAHLLDGKTEHALLWELFTKDGTGTMITTREEEKRYVDE